MRNSKFFPTVSLELTLLDESYMLNSNISSAAFSPSNVCSRTYMVLFLLALLSSGGLKMK